MLQERIATDIEHRAYQVRAQEVKALLLSPRAKQA
jgi:hypothetical protein